jgi:tripartite-type tricarboxylate transporter receptor subunit TctC
MTTKIWLALAFVLPSSTLEAQAQNWPARPIEMIIPYAAGGGVDIIGRSVAAAMSDELGQKVVVVNRDGAGGTLGFNALAAAPPDGHTLVAGPSTPITSAPYLVKGIRYRPESFDYICQVFENVFSIAVPAHSKFKSAKDLLAAATAYPGKLTYGHAGIGQVPHLSVENLADSLKLKFQGVPFRGDSAMLPVLLKGDLDFGAAAVSSIQGQDIRALAVFADERHPAAPDVPTAKELGVLRSVPPGFNGVYAPTGLSAAVRASLERACSNAVRGEAVRQATTRTGQIISYLDGAEFYARTVADHQFKGELIRRLGLQTE